MYKQFVVYPSAVEKIEKSGLAERIENKYKDYGNFDNYGGCYSSQIFEDLSEEGFYSKISPDLKKILKIYAFSGGKGLNFKYKSKIFNEELRLEDSFNDLSKIVLGYNASYVLSSEELVNHDEFGFDNPVSFMGTVSAYIMEKYSNLFDKSHQWTHENNGRIFESAIYGDTNGDMKIVRYDITNYDSFDPFGNTIEYRPIFNKDTQCVNSYHSVEPAVLVSIIRYVEELGIESKLLKNNAKEALDFISSLGDYRGNFGEAFDGSNGRRYNFDLLGDYSLGKLDEDYNEINRTFNHLSGHITPTYGIYSGPKKELVFFVKRNKEKIRVKPKQLYLSFMNVIKKRRASMVIYPEEIDDFLTSLLLQCSNGCGRTNIQTMGDIIKMKYSPDFEEKRQKFYENYNKD